LTQLDVPNNMITAEGARYLSEALRHNTVTFDPDLFIFFNTLSR